MWLPYIIYYSVKHVGAGLLPVMLFAGNGLWAYPLDGYSDSGIPRDWMLSAMLNSVAIVEYPTAEQDLYYRVVVMSNVLYQNSAGVHQTLATRRHRFIQQFHQSENDSRKRVSN